MKQFRDGAPLRRRAQAGMTLIEILVVVVIISILGALIVPNVIGRDDDARVTAAVTDLNALSAALNIYKLDNLTYPTSDQGLRALVEQPQTSPEAKNWNPRGYLSTNAVPSDPWGNEYQYISNGTDFDLYSYGADGQQGGEGYAADLKFGEL